MFELIAIGAVILVLVFWLISVYNKFQTLKTQIEASIQEIGNQLKRQAELIPNLVNSVKGYMKHESQVFKMITDARKGVEDAVKNVQGEGATDVQQLINASEKLQQALQPIRLTFESTPELKAEGPTSKLMDELRDTSDKVMYARRTLIDLTQDFNQMVVTVPSNFVAMLFSFKKQPGLKMPDADAATTATAEEMKTPKVNLE